MTQGNRFIMTKKTRGNVERGNISFIDGEVKQTARDRIHAEGERMDTRRKIGPIDSLSER